MKYHLKFTPNFIRMITLLLGMIVFGLAVSPAFAAPSLAIRIVPSKTNPVPGESVVYSVRFRCASITEDCLGATVSATIDSQMAISFYTNTSGVAVSSTNSGNTINWTLKNPLPAGTTAVLAVTANFPACGTSTPTSATSTASFSATNAGTVNDSTVVTQNGSTPACPSEPPPTTGFTKKSTDAIIDGTTEFIIEHPALTGTTVFEDVLPSGFVVTNISNPNTSTTEVQCGDYSPTGTWYTLPVGSNLQSWIENQGSGGTIPGTTCKYINSPVDNKPITNVRAIRYTFPSPTGSLIIYVNGRWMSSNPFSTTDYVGFDPVTQGETVQNCIENTTASTTACSTKIATHGIIGNIVKDSNWGIGTLADNLPTSPTQKTWKLFYYPGYYVNIVNPTVVDLLPVGMTYIPGTDAYNFDFPNDSNLQPAYRVSAQSGCMNPVFSAIENYAGTGRTLVRWQFNNCIIYTAQSQNTLRIAFTSTIKPGVTAGTQLRNFAYTLNNNTNLQYHGYFCNANSSSYGQQFQIRNLGKIEILGNGTLFSYKNSLIRFVDQNQVMM